MEEHKTAAGRYSQLTTERDQFLNRARDCAKYTIPTLVPPDNAGPSTKYPTPYQGMGAEGLNNLASKLLLALLPPNQPFFRLQIDDFTLEEMAQQEGMRGEFEKAVSRVERSIMTHLEVNKVRSSVHEALKYLLISGNVLLHKPLEEGMRVFRLDRYVVLRDPMGNILEIITKESVSPETIPQEILSQVQKSDEKQAQHPYNPSKTMDLYTWIRRDEGEWTVHQEIGDTYISGSEGTYPLDKLPWLPLRWTAIDGESYGRGYIEEFLGDLKTLEGLTKAIVIGSSAAAKVVFFVNPNGTTKLSVVSKAESGDVVQGSAQDVSTLQMEKRADFSTALETAQIVTNRLARAFMLNTAVQRDAERVTAEEIRYVAQELEDALGGVYSILSQEFQLPLVKILMTDMEDQGILPPLPEEMIRPTITTGLEALGRGHDLQRLEVFKQVISELGPEVTMTYLNVGEYLKRTGASLGIEMEGLIKSEEQVQQEREQQQMMQMAQQLGPEALQQAGGMAQEAMRQGGQPDGSQA